MAKVLLNTALNGIRGAIDNWVYRKTADGMIVARRPEITAAPTAAQLQIRENFRAAAAYARVVQLDPELLARYQLAAKAQKLGTFAFTIADYLRSPEVDAIDVTGYHGAIGNVIRVRASDDFEVASVAVLIRDAANTVLEQGAAVLTDGQWHYTATVAIPAGVQVAIEATATDRPGHTGNRTVTHVIA